MTHHDPDGLWTGDELHVEHVPPALSRVLHVLRLPRGVVRLLMASDMEALVCADCLAEVSVPRGIGVYDSVRVVSVGHESTCPWLARVAPEDATLSYDFGVLVHFARPE